MELILASGSPRRRELLEQIGLSFSVHPADVEEVLDPAWTAREAVEHLSAQKAEAVAGQFPDDLVLAADTIVSLDEAILGKPRNEDDAFAMLQRLSGRSHKVYTGMTLRQGEKTVTLSVETTVVFRALTGREISAYIAAGESLDKAGAYGIQGLGSVLIDRIEGDYFNVMGLPVCTLSQVLAKEFDWYVL